MTVILGIDPGSRRAGFGVVTLVGGRPEYLASGLIRAGKAALAERLGEIHAGTAALVAQYRPAAVAVEDVFVARDPRAALRLGQARGAALAAVAAAGIPVVEYSPRTVKQAVVGTGAATKEQVQRMVMQILRLPAAPRPTPPMPWRWRSAMPTAALAACPRAPDAEAGCVRWPGWG